MDLQAVSIYDHKAQCYSPPLYVRQIGQAVRWFTQQVADPNSDHGRFPADYALMHVGHFDDETGISVNLDAGPQLIASGITIAASLQAQAPAADVPPGWAPDAASAGRALRGNGVATS